MRKDDESHPVYEFLAVGDRFMLYGGVTLGLGASFLSRSLTGPHDGMYWPWAALWLVLAAVFFALLVFHRRSQLPHVIGPSRRDVPDPTPEWPHAIDYRCGKNLPFGGGHCLVYDLDTGEQIREVFFYDYRTGRLGRYVWHDAAGDVTTSMDRMRDAMPVWQDEVRAEFRDGDRVWDPASRTVTTKPGAGA